MAFTVKATAISPKPFNVGNIRKNIRLVLREEGIKDSQQLRKTTEGWSSAPAMKYAMEITGDSASVWIGPTGTEELVEKWRRIDEPGRAQRHDITARNAPTLKFPWQGPKRSYDAKTKPKHFGRAGSGQKLGKMITPKTVDHPGIYEPREWSITLANERIKPFADAVQEAINKALRK